MITCSHRCIQMVHRAKQNTTSQETQLIRFQSNNSFWRCFLLSESLCETSTGEMLEFSSRSWSQGRDGFLAIHDDLEWELAEPLKTTAEAMPPLMQTGKQRLKEREWLAKASLHQWGNRDLDPAFQGSPRGQNPDTTHKPTNFDLFHRP